MVEPQVCWTAICIGAGIEYPDAFAGCSIYGGNVAQRGAGVEHMADF